MNADGSNRTQLTFDGGQDGAPSLSADGTKIVYTKWSDSTPSHKQIWEMSADGSGQTLLDDPPAGSSYYTDDNPTWSPDGTKVVFQSARTGWNNIYIINAAGTGLTQVSNQPAGSDNIYPAYSPDGTKIIFESGNGLTINTITLSSSILTPLYTAAAQLYEPRYSPDGSTIS
jgi:Tol biopolymer transport system component